LSRNQIKKSRAELNLDTCQCTQFLYCQLLSFSTATRKTYFEFGPKLMLKDWRLDVRFWIYAEFLSALRLEDQTYSYPFIFQLLEIKIFLCIYFSAFHFNDICFYNLLVHIIFLFILLNTCINFLFFN
jgi:hypothetical protein